MIFLVLTRLCKHVDLELRALVVRESQTRFVDPKCLSVNLSTVSTRVAVWTECNQVVVIVRKTCFPRNNVMNFDRDVSARGYCTAMAGLDHDFAFDFSGYWRAASSRHKV
jgi:hypothetical protein